ncbi:hypothetical protein RER_11960 [Rhodococcus erythropolis PR4]|uniref:Uncharacterized protein n=1 Tax=Rhodococcus erythropolis (strain PR4 / NBRC 100887) TaxID=234621 RepID=C0ZST1_RHOE4|nr:hypothetical protein RER_11960 [Rhodococcus erythropolis PR4]
MSGSKEPWPHRPDPSDIRHFGEHYLAEISQCHTCCSAAYFPYLKFLAGEL